MRILQVVNHFHPCTGGKESIVKELSLRLAKKGHKVGVVCLNKCADSNAILPAQGQWNGIGIKRLSFLDLKFLKIAFPPLKELKEANVVHAHGLCFLTDFLMLAKPLYRKPLVLSTHGGIFHTKTLSFLKKIYFHTWLRLAGMAVDKVIAVSRNDFELFSKIFPGEKMVLIENAVDVEKFGAVKRRAAGNSFLFVGRLSRNKRVDRLLDAFALVTTKKRNAVLTIVGKDFDNILGELKGKAKELGIESQVRFEGMVSEAKLLEVFSSHQFFVSASSYEGFGVSTVEAMAAGLVPVLNDIPSFRGFVNESRSGVFVNFEDKNMAMGKLEWACSLGSEEIEKLGLKAREYAKRFSWESRTGEFEGIYKALES